MKLVYSRPILHDLSQGSRITFARHFRLMSQDEVAGLLGAGGKCRRRTMTRYEKGDRNPEVSRTKKIANILNVSYYAIKRYDYKDPLDVIYSLMWYEELFPNYHFDLSEVKELNEEYLIIINDFITEWESMRLKRKRKEIKYSEYIEWKLTYDLNK